MDEPKPKEEGASGQKEGAAPPQEDEREVYGQTGQVGEPLSSDPYASPVVSEMLEDVPSYMARGIIYVLLLILGAGAAWSYFGKMDVVVQGRGQLAPLGETNIVQVQKSGHISETLVKVGDRVKKGQVLAKLDVTADRVAQEKKEKEFESRKRDRECLKYAAYLYRRTLDGAKAQETETEFLRLCSSQFAGEIAAIYQATEQFQQAKLKREQVYPSELASLADAVKVKETARQNKKKQLEIAAGEVKRVKAQHDIYQTMVSKGLSSQIRLLEKQKEYDEAVSKIGNAEVELRTAENDLKDARIRLANKRFEYDNEWKQALSSYSHSVRAARQKLSEYELKLEESGKSIEQMEMERKLDRYESRYSDVAAPMDGIISEAHLKNPKQVVQIGTGVFSIVPLDQPMVGRVLLPNKHIGRVRTGLPVKLKFEAFPYQNYGLGRGRVLAISPDAKQIGNESFYEITVALDNTSLVRGKKEFQLFMGLTFLGEIVVERQRIIDVFLQPFKSLRER